GRRTVGFQYIGYHTDGIGVFILRRKDSSQGAHRQVAMAYFPSSGTSVRLHLTGRESRKIVVEKKLVVAGMHRPVNHLLIHFGSQCTGGNRLGFPTGKYG